MKKIVVASDSFKGTLSSNQICQIVSEALTESYPAWTCVGVPIADGGEGTIDALSEILHGRTVKTEVCGPYFDRKVTAEYLLCGEKEQTAIIEIASCAGLPLVGEEKNPALTTTYGVGMQMADAIAHGAREIILCLGGSCTNDCACGTAAALGTVFKNADGEKFLPTGGTLGQIVSMDCSQTEKLLQGITVRCMCDVKNPMTGKTGASYVFARQKGADDEMIAVLEKNMLAFRAVLQRQYGVDAQTIEGGGAAGAFGAGASVMFRGSLSSGIETILQLVHFDDIIRDAALVITGEGRVDSQSFGGKVLSGVSRYTRRAGVPLLVLAGSSEEFSVEEMDKMGILGIFPTLREVIPFSELKEHAQAYYRSTFCNVMRLLEKDF